MGIEEAQLRPCDAVHSVILPPAYDGNWISWAGFVQLPFRNERVIGARPKWCEELHGTARTPRYGSDTRTRGLTPVPGNAYCTATTVKSEGQRRSDCVTFEPG
jgi:hypothetical protein